MRRFKVTILLSLVLTLFFVADTLRAFDVYGQGSATWGDTKGKIKGRFGPKLRKGLVKFVKDTRDVLIVDYYDQKIRQKKYEFRKNGLVRISVYYYNPPRRIENTHRKKYGPPSYVNGVLTWTFPSTIITYKKGGQKVVFRDRSWIPTKTGTTSAGNIGQVKIGMTPQQVRNIMGTPVSTASQAGGIMYYRYTTGIVTFKFNKVIRVTKGVVGPAPIKKIR